MPLVAPPLGGIAEAEGGLGHKFKTKGDPVQGASHWPGRALGQKQGRGGEQPSTPLCLPGRPLVLAQFRVSRTCHIQQRNSSGRIGAARHASAGSSVSGRDVLPASTPPTSPSAPEKPNHDRSTCTTPSPNK